MAHLSHFLHKSAPPIAKQAYIHAAADESHHQSHRPDDDFLVTDAVNLAHRI
jgi:hypothetical protein